ncbi:hypothetical protein QBC46DRAFT_335820 [Diplogelasinospora grovesii]|uniref:Uncharacterized protein n=1 Tax=Diplogelasinospora grovesii TaxID=303347 RepID=A0AAN6NK90_9PEZI|nr:hypothetical protein QBC46DRAFT_335820 [Diplogelasinospora grovesii]
MTLNKSRVRVKWLEEAHNPPSLVNPMGLCGIPDGLHDRREIDGGGAGQWGAGAAGGGMSTVMFTPWSSIEPPSILITMGAMVFNAVRSLEMKSFYKDGERQTATPDIDNATHATAIALYILMPAKALSPCRNYESKQAKGPCKNCVVPDTEMIRGACSQVSRRNSALPPLVSCEDYTCKFIRDLFGNEFQTKAIEIPAEIGYNPARLAGSLMGKSKDRSTIGGTAGQVLEHPQVDLAALVPPLSSKLVEVTPSRVRYVVNRYSRRTHEANAPARLHARTKSRGVFTPALVNIQDDRQNDTVGYNFMSEHDNRHWAKQASSALLRRIDSDDSLRQKWRQGKGLSDATVRGWKLALAVYWAQVRDSLAHEARTEGLADTPSFHTSQAKVEYTSQRHGPLGPMGISQGVGNGCRPLLDGGMRNIFIYNGAVATRTLYNNWIVFIIPFAEFLERIQQDDTPNGYVFTLRLTSQPDLLDTTDVTERLKAVSGAHLGTALNLQQMRHVLKGFARRFVGSVASAEELLSTSVGPADLVHDDEETAFLESMEEMSGHSARHGSHEQHPDLLEEFRNKVRDRGYEHPETRDTSFTVFVPAEHLHDELFIVVASLLTICHGKETMLSSLQNPAPQPALEQQSSGVYAQSLRIGNLRGYHGECSLTSISRGAGPRPKCLALCVNTGGIYKTPAELEASDTDTDLTAFQKYLEIC